MSLDHIVGREDEITELKRLLVSPRSEFLAMYGRRRVGKTYLIRTFFESNIIFDTAGILNGNLQEQMETFWRDSKKVFPNIKKPKNWIAAFNMLKENLDLLPNSTKKVIFIDEIAWFDTQKSGFLRALDNFWNQYCTKRNDILLVICGSATSWIIDKVINDKGGLHNRVTKTIHLQPFTIKETKKYLNNIKVKLNDQDIIELYMLIGGIPFYLNHVKPANSISQIIDDLFINSNAQLKFEFDKLFASLFKNYELHISIIEALSSKNSGMTRNEIIEKSKLTSGGAVTKALLELKECDFIITSNPFQKKKVSTVYRLIDEYSLFYLNFLKRGNRYTGHSIYTSQKYNVWTGYAFENFCFRHEAYIAKALGIWGILYDLFSWSHKGNEIQKGAQIDMIFDRSDNTINLFEIKYSRMPYTITKKYSNDLLNKKETFRIVSESKKNIYLTVISNNDFVRNPNYLSVVDNEVSIIDAIRLR
jgi:uncharacterized protein